MRVICGELPPAVHDAVVGAAGLLALPAEPASLGDGVEAGDADLVVLYGRPGVDAVRELRARRSGVRVLLLADVDGWPTRAEALEAGADDWAAGTLDATAAVPHLRALVTLEQPGPRTLRLPGCVVDLVSRRVRRADGAEARLTVQEARLLEHLAASPGVPVARDVLLTAVWGYHPNVVSRAPDVAIRRLRTKIEADPGDPRLVVTGPDGGWALRTDARLRPGPAPRRAPDPDLVGRDEALARIDAAWADDARVVAIVGPPGVGKTALGARVVHGAPWPVARVVLDGARDVADVVHAVARAAEAPVGDADDVDDAVARTARALDARGVLVWLDGADLVAGALVPLLDRWVDEAPGARFLVGSRERLHGREREVRLEPLVPADAARLFLRRARAAGFEAAADDPELDRLVRALDGLPLAIELAAARVRTLGLAALLDDDGVRLDRLGGRGRDGRGARTLDDAVAASWDALDDVARGVLAAVAQLPSGFDLATAEAVAPVAGGWVGDVLVELEDRSLLRVAPSPAGHRYVIPEAVRWYAARRLADDDARARLVGWALGRRHAAEGDPANLRAALDAADALEPATFAELALHVDALLEGSTPLREREALLARAATRALPEPLALRVRLRAHEVAWARGREPGADAWRALAAEAGAVGETPVAERATLALARCLRAVRAPPPWPDLDALVERSTDPSLRVQALRERAREHAEAGRWHDGRLALDRALAVDAAAGLGLRARIRLDAARLALDAFRPDDGLPLVEAVLADPAAADARLRETAWSMLGGVLLTLGRHDEATTAYERALALEEDLGLLRPAAVTLGNLGILYAELGDPAESRRALERAIAAHRELRQARSETTARVNLGQTELLEGQIDHARALLDEGRRAADAAAWPVLSAAARYGLGTVEALAGDDDAAARWWEEVVDAAEALEHRWIAALAAAHLGALAAHRGDEVAARRWRERTARNVASVTAPGVRGAVAVLGGEPVALGEPEPVEVRLARAVLERRRGV
jgi:DNA-binding response OmpR family regulator/predicted ATPase/tetratricopeptide (TPR) repeat protein